jgi:hypothetical protein
MAPLRQTQDKALRYAQDIQVSLTYKICNVFSASEICPHSSAIKKRDCVHASPSWIIQSFRSDVLFQKYHLPGVHYATCCQAIEVYT